MSDSLQDIYRWVHGYIRREFEATTEEVARYIVPNTHLPAKARLDIHRDQHWRKTSSAMESELPATHRFMGCEAFKVMVDTYLHVCPPQSASLISVKRELPDFLRETPEFPFQEFLEELIALEILVSDLAQEPATPSLALTDLPDGDDWLKRVLVAVPGVRLLALNCRVHDFMESKGHPGAPQRAEWAQPQPNWLLVVKRQFRIYRHPITQMAFDLLQKLIEGHPPSKVAPMQWRGTPELIKSWIEWGVFATLAPARTRRARTWKR
ncbi:MAG TPA: putative DNA-binding domain-containing protein [Candidatus Xenobia bacterium]|jgi:hypothetical protein